MATEKTFVINITEKGSENVIKQLGVFENKVSDTLENTQKASKQAVKEMQGDWEYLFRDISVRFDKIGDGIKPVTREMQSLQDISLAFAKNILPNMQKINSLNNDILGKEKDLNALKQKSLKIEIDALNKTSEAVAAHFKKYDEEESKLWKKGQERKEQQIAELDKWVAAEIAAGKDVRMVNEARAQQIEDIEKGLMVSIKANLDKRNEELKTHVEKNIELINTQYEQNRKLLLEDAELNKQQTRLAYEQLKEKAKTDEEKAVLNENLNARLLEMDKELNIKLGENSKAQLEATKTAVAQAITDITATVSDGKKINGILDVDLTKANIEAVKQQLEDYKATLNGSYAASMLHFAALETAYKDDAIKLKEIQEAKKQTMAQFSENHKDIEKAITETSKAENDLRLEQLKDYAGKAEKIAAEIKGFTDKTADYLGTAFSSVTDIYKAEIEGIDEQVTHIDAKQKEYTGIKEEQNLKIKELEAQRQRAIEANNLAEVSSLDAKITKEKDLKKEAEDEETALENREKELNNKKAKKQAEQEKIDKLKRKADLLKKIGEATADIARGVTQALSYGPFLGPVLAAVVAAAGAVQIGIMSKQLAKFEQGGLLRGRRHAQGGMRVEGTNIEVEGGEYIINRETTSHNLGLISYINNQRKQLAADDLKGYFAKASSGAEVAFSRKFESGGYIAPSLIETGSDTGELIDAIRSMKFEPRVAVTDILRVQEQMTSVDGWSGM